MLVDLHVHSRHTPGCSLDPALAIEKAEAIGLDGICFTDLGGWPLAAELPNLRAATDLAVLVGAEIPTDHGHYLVFVPDPAAADPEAILGPRTAGALWPARAMVERVRAAGGAVVAAHPYDRHVERPAGDFVFTLRGLAAIEGITGTRSNDVNELAIEAADLLSLPCVGGSAAMDGYDRIGRAATLFRDPVRDEAQLVAALRAGAVWAVQIGEPPRFVGDEIALRERERPDRPDERRGGDRRRRGGRRRGGAHR